MFKENQELYTGYAGLAEGIGMWIGPSIGSLVYSLTNYSLTFILMGSIILLAAIYMIFSLPSSLNVKMIEKTDQNGNTRNEHVSYT